MIIVDIILVILVFKLMRDDAVQMYKIGYYEEKLRNRKVDISHIKNITLREIWK